MFPDTEDTLRLRHQMVAEQIARRGIEDEHLLEAFRRVPRHSFVPLEYQDWAYADSPLPIGYGQTISQPYIVALMIHLLGLRGDERVLEIGTGSGYQAAILACLTKEVHTMEYIPELAQEAEKRLKRLGFGNVHCHIGDGSLGWPPAAPYQGILVAAAAPQVPPPLLEQLDEGARLVIPVGNRGYQELQVWQRRGERFESQVVTGVAFVPLRGAHGWQSEDFW
ncbi:MAG: protein-L-isoaspartate(D-aspartate) O-methyltransferase [Anaerolineales bacterium]